jgi:hypothetical protein
MHHHKIIAAITVLTVTGSIAIALGLRPAPSSVNLERSELAISSTVGQQAMLLAASEQAIVENQNQATADKGSQTAEPAVESAEDSGKSPRGQKNKSFKPFAPSEEIAAEQAVDFPVDI